MNPLNIGLAVRCFDKKSLFDVAWSDDDVPTGGCPIMSKIAPLWIF